MGSTLRKQLPSFKVPSNLAPLRIQLLTFVLSFDLSLNLGPSFTNLEQTGQVSTTQYQSSRLCESKSYLSFLQCYSFQDPFQSVISLRRDQKCLDQKASTCHLPRFEHSSHHPLFLFLSPQLLPPAAYSNSVTSVGSSLVHTSTNKIRCAVDEVLVSEKVKDSKSFRLYVESRILNFLSFLHFISPPLLITFYSGCLMEDVF